MKYDIQEILLLKNMLDYFKYNCQYDNSKNKVKQIEKSKFIFSTKKTDHIVDSLISEYFVRNKQNMHGNDIENYNILQAKIQYGL